MYTVTDCTALRTRGAHRTHAPRGMSTGATIEVTSRIEQVLLRILCSCMAISKVTAYRIYNNVHIVKLKRWGQMLRIIMYTMTLLFHTEIPVPPDVPLQIKNPPSAAAV